MEALFIGLLCYYHHGLESAFRYYYLLSLICCSIRYSTQVTYATWALHSASYVMLYLVLPEDRRQELPLWLMLVVLGWVTWAGAAMAQLLKQVGNYLGRLNAALEENRAELEERIAERSRQLQESQAHVLHQEKMAGFGLLAAGIAHEVGNPLTSISALVQMLQRRDQDAYTREKLALVSGQLQRIQTTLRELVNFSRPASTVRTRVLPAEALNEALNIAKYYKRARPIETRIEPGLPAVLGVRDQLVQVFLNLILNALDATTAGGRVFVRAASAGSWIDLQVQDTGIGMGPAEAERLFQPYFTTKADGTGLGLFVTRKLITDHGGTIDFETQPAVGTTFHIRLPGVPEALTGRLPSQPEARETPAMASS